MSSSAAQRQARQNYQFQQRLNRQAAAAVRELWRDLNLDDVRGSWTGDVGPRVLSLLIAAQEQAARAGAAYVDQAAIAQGAAAAPGAVVAEELAGVASDGRDVMSLLSVPAIRLLQLIGGGTPPEEAAGRALRELIMIVSTQVADAGRVAAGLGVAGNPNIAGYERVVTLPACGRCIILAGRLYPYSTGFARHPRCDCQMIPVTIEQWQHERPQNTPEKLFAQMSPQDQDKAFTAAGAEAIRDGADLAQVVNARRGMYTAGGRRFTTEGITSRGLAGMRLGRLAKEAGSKYRRSTIPRIMPEQIYADAEQYGWDRDELLRQLQRFGYITDTGDVTGRGRRTDVEKPVDLTGHDQPGPPAEQPADREPATDQARPAEPPEAAPGNDERRGAEAADVRDMSDQELEQQLLAAMDDGEFDQDLFDRVSAEIDRREAEQQAREQARERDRERSRRRREQRDADRAERLAELLDSGWDEEEAVAEVYGTSIDQQRRDRAISALRGEGFTGDRFEELARASYKEYLYRQWLAAEEATRGVLLTRAGQNAGIDPRELFSGPEARARKWASDELKAWWDRHGRLTFAEYQAGLLGDAGEARRLREARGGDFLA